MLILPMQGFFNALVYFHSITKQQPGRRSTTEQATHSSSFFATPFQSFRSWGSFLRLISWRHSAASSELIEVAVAHVVKAQEKELQDSEEEGPFVVAITHDVMPQEDVLQYSEEKDPIVVAVTHDVMPQEEEFEDSEEEDPVVVTVTHGVMPQEIELQDSEEEDPVVVVEPIESCN
jgi:hypothetical protein